MNKHPTGLSQRTPSAWRGKGAIGARLAAGVVLGMALCVFALGYLAGVVE